ncbi:MAG: LLM class F420-dependent oxidoreductase [Acidobacteria bacterium]|nr:LLM class F420-dependent oxidoreductase [Acidobacteriota bacterium]MCH8985401.1 LLM class F420-dependent oxidoreductase [Acidobacteriota bacterium]
MRLGLNIGYWGSGQTTPLELVIEAEKLGYDVVWAAEAWGSDVVTVLTWIAARTEKIKVGAGVMQIPARTPAMTAMTAVTLNELSGGRFELGLGVSGPQVVEGWHGLAYGKPLGKTREYVEILRKIFARDEPVTHDGMHYAIPYQGDDATGLGKPLRLITHPTHDVPILIASIGPKNVELTAEIADGWLPIFYSPMQAPKVYQPLLDTGFEKSGDPNKSSTFDIAPSLSVVITDDLEAGRRQMKPMAALYIGGMGAKGRNFYNTLACRYGYEEAAEKIQDLYLAGNKMAATEAVPDDLVEQINLIGPRKKVAEEIEIWKAAGVTTMNVAATDIATLRTLAELVL